MKFRTSFSFWPRPRPGRKIYGFLTATSAHPPLTTRGRCGHRIAAHPALRWSLQPPRAALRTRSSASDARPGDAPEVARRSHLGLPKNGCFHFSLALQVSCFTWAGINEPDYPTEGNLRNSNVWIEKGKLCRNPGSNQGPLDLQSNALPTELFRLLAGTVLSCFPKIVEFSVVRAKFTSFNIAHSFAPIYTGSPESHV